MIKTLQSVEGIAKKGMLFNIVSPQFYESIHDGNHNVKDYFCYKEVSAKNAPAGTFSSMPGMCIHAGAPTKIKGENCCRIIMFWTGYNSKHNKTGYTGNIQHTKLTLMIEIAILLWPKVTSKKNRKEILTLIALSMRMCREKYIQLCPQNFTDDELHILIKDISENISNKKGLNKVLNKHATKNKI